VNAPSLRLAPAAFLLGGALMVYPLLGAGTALPLLATLGGAALLLCAVGVAGVWPAALTAAVGLLATEYLVSLYLKGVRLDLAAPVYAGCLFAWAELSWLVVEGQVAERWWLARWLAVAGLAPSAAALGWAVLIVAALPIAGGLALTALGVVAALAVAAGVRWLARSA
jgi:hypothetical protein